MAFFKFRQRGPIQSEPRGRGGEPAARPQETVETLRRRARHRLLGAAVLVLVAVIGFPLLFDTEPRPVTVDTPISIPDQDRVPPLRASSAPSSVNGRVGAASSSSTGASSGAPVIITTPSGSGNDAAAMTQAPVLAPARPASASARRADVPTPARRETEAEAARVRALLGERSALPRPAPPAGSAAGRFVVQIGAFVGANMASQVRQQAERTGLKIYIQVVNAKGGKRTRVRAGPYASRADAERAAAVLRKAGLSGSVQPL
ncbi:MAG: SPOR domain-containing protein [Burkholderiaceae bacterium]|jgi:DedD protein|nr:SPOR domain-containing protein [Burkholderiaceae bacterium]